MRFFKCGWFVIFPVLFIFSACEADDPTGPEESRIVAGIDFDILFAPATSAEIGLIEADWAARDASAAGVEIVYSLKETISFIGDAGLEQVDTDVAVVSHTIGGGAHYGMMITPSAAVDVSLPIIYYMHGGDGGVTLNEIKIVFLNLGLDLSQFVLIAPSFRGETLNVGNTTFTSQAPDSPWDYDVDDAIALLNSVIQINPLADSTRIGVLGFSRGGGAGLLMAIRDSRIDRMVDFFGPTDFFDEYVQDIVRDILEGVVIELPGLDYLSQNYIEPLESGAITIDDVRLELIRRSPALFAADLPTLQIHHGTNDNTVSISQTESLIEALDALGGDAPEFVAYIYDVGGHNPFELSGSLITAGLFLNELVAGPPAALANN